MPKNYLMAVDAGTGSVRAVLFNLSGEQVGCVQREWEHQEDSRYPGSMDFNWVANWQLACNCIHEVIKNTGIDPREIAAVSTTCMREGIVLYNKDGQEIWACANVDARSTAEVHQLIQLDPNMEKQIYLQSGETFALGALPRLLWVKKNMSQIYEQTTAVGMFNDWLSFKMTGKLAVEPSNGSTTGIFDLQAREWDPIIAQKCDIRTDIFPPVIECGKIIACVNASGSADSGLPEGTPVVVGGGDAQLGSIGVGVVQPGQAAIFGGSFWQYEFNTADGTTDPECRIRVNCHAVPGVWQYEALAFKPGLVLRWFRDAFCKREIELGSTQGDDPYCLMDQQAKKIPAGCYGMMCTFSDVMNFISWKHASPTFTNFELDAGKFNCYTFYRAILENTAMVTRGHLELVQKSTGNMPSEVVFAGGASKSPLWCQILSDVLGMPVKVPVVKEATALGAAILAGYGVGIYKDIPTAVNQIVKWDQIYTPNIENKHIYDAMYQPWRNVYDAQLQLADKGLTRHMWLAPGL